MTEFIPKKFKEEENLKAAYDQHMVDLDNIIATGNPAEKKLAQGQKFLLKLAREIIKKKGG